MKTPKVKTVLNRAQEWAKLNNDSWERGKNAIEFIEQGEQWDQKSLADREYANKSTLQFNLVYKHLRAMQAKGKNIELSLNLNATNDAWKNNVEETNAFRMLLNHIMLGEEQKRSFANSLDKVYSYGQSALFVDVVRENEETLNNTIAIRCINDPSQAFFDKNAQSLTRNDGAYCGLKIAIDKGALLALYPALKGKGIAQEKNIVIDYWWRESKNVKFMMLIGGEFKREDMLTDDDVLSNGGEFETGPVTVIKYMRILNERVKPLEPAQIWPAEDLPLVYNYGLTIWTPQGMQSYPFGSHMQDAQIMHNVIGSQIATMVKNTTSDKWFLTPDMVQSQRAKEAASNINQIEGAVILDKDIDGIQARRESSSQIPPSIMQAYEQSKQEIEDIAGAFMDASSEVRAISGVALDKMFNRQDILQNNVVMAHIHTIDTVGKIVRRMISRVYTENRSIVIETPNGDAQSIEINKRLATGKIQNNIKDIDSNFHYKITAGISTGVENKNVITFLNELYGLVPQAAPLTLDIYMKCLDTPYAEELSRRTSGMVDPSLVAYSQGMMSQQQFQQQQQMQQQQQQQQQAQSPQAQLINAKVQSEQSKAQTSMFKAQTERQKMIDDRVVDQTQAQVQMQQIQSDNYNQEMHRQLEAQKAMIGHYNDLLKMYKNVGGY